MSGGLFACGLLHGADYNYEQWLDFPELLDKDLVYMRKAGINVLTLGVFSWSMLESVEGVYNFDWLDQCFEKLHQNGQKIILATPSGSKPAWLSEKYPEVRQMAANGLRQPHGWRHNHCRSSVKYREACVRINTRLAQRYGKHPALILWHVSNEYNGMPCFCPQCLAAFRNWLKKRYETLDILNAAWYTTFWSHRFTSWEQIFPADSSIHGLMLDWRRFTSDQTIDFFLTESEPLRASGIPITTNFHGPDVGLDYHKFSRHLDIISWDNYPEWHNCPDDEQTAVKAAFFHDMCRSYLNKPFLMMESAPGANSWQGISKKKKKGMHILSSIQAVAHGSDSVQYFQWRQSRGGQEKFHDSVVSHLGTDDTRIFREVAETGSLLKKLNDISGTNTKAQAAVVYDFQNSWALDNAQLQRNTGKNYQEECIAHYGAFWKAGVPCDIISPEYSDFEQYRLVILPMLYMISEKTAEKIRLFVKQGGVAVATYLTGLVNESDLCYLGGTPGGLTGVFGVAVEETETIACYETPEFLMNGNYWKASHYADRVRLQGAHVLGAFTSSFEEMPAVTACEYGKGTAYYLCTRAEQTFINHFNRELCEKHGLEISLAELPAGVFVRKRGDVVFVLNFNYRETTVSLGENLYYNLLNGQTVCGTISLQPYGIIILTNKSDSCEKKSKT